MFTQEQLEGIIISMAYPEAEIYRDDNQSIGYKIRLRVNFISWVCNEVVNNNIH